MNPQFNNELLKAVNSAAAALLSTDSDKDFEESIVAGMESICRCINADRIHIWQNEIRGGELCFVNKYEWLTDYGKTTSPPLSNAVYSYSRHTPEWESRFMRNEHTACPVSQLPPSDAAFLSSFGVKSIILIPLFDRNRLWGFFSADDSRNERSLTEDEINFLRSAGLMMMSAILRHEMTMRIIQANEAKSDFLAKMSHEMRTPLNAILGLAELTLADCGMSGEAETNLEQIFSAGSTLLSLVNDILDISKIEAGRLTLVESEYDVPSLINDAITQNILRLGSKPIEFTLDIDGSMFERLYGDELRIKQILNNLLSNAFKYTEKGTITLAVSCEREHERESGVVWVTIKVEDTGIGISPEDLPAVFTDFEQFNVAGNRNIEGTGLGLSITNRIVELMDGTITVESRRGEGSVFTVRIAQKYSGGGVIGKEMALNLRAFRYSDNKRDKNAHLTRIKLPYARVLVVDDIVTNLNVAKGFLKQYGMKVDCVTSGQKAIDAIREGKYRYNAIFMDHMMPELDGIEAARIIRNEIDTQYARDIPIIAFSANAIFGNEEMFLSKGFQAFIAKPIDINRLDEVVRRWVRDKSKENYETLPDKAAPGIDEDAENIIDIPGIDRQKTLSLFGGENSLFISVLQAFVASTPALLVKLEAVTEESLSDYCITIHGFKGSCASIGAGELRDIALQLEMSAKKGDFSEVFEKNLALIKDTRVLIENIRRQLDVLSSGHSKPVLPAPDPALLSRLYRRCEEYDMNGIEEILAELAAYDYEKGGELVKWVAQRIEMSEFIEAAVRIRIYEEELGEGKSDD